MKKNNSIENIKNNHTKKDWEIIERDLDIIINSQYNNNNKELINEILYENNIQITFDNLLDTFSSHYIWYMELLGETIALEKFEISSKVKIVMDYNKKEVIEIAKKNLPKEDVEDLKEIIIDFEVITNECIALLADLLKNKED